MKIIRAEIKDTDIFNESELDFGACCFFTEDKVFKYFFEIHGQEAILFTNTNQYISEAIEELIFQANFTGFEY